MSVWNTSWLLSQHSVIGSILHTLIGYVDRPMGIQVITYLLTLFTIGTLMKWVNEKTIPRALATGTAGTRRVHRFSQHDT
jgi:high-affinity iron transporter